jgi:hypothetical protein
MFRRYFQTEEEEGGAGSSGEEEAEAADDLPPPEEVWSQVRPATQLLWQCSSCQQHTIAWQAVTAVGMRTYMCIALLQKPPTTCHHQRKSGAS